MVAAGAADPVSGLANTSGSAITVRDPFYTNGSIAGITNFTGQTQYLNVLPQGRLDPNAVKLLGLYPNPTAGRTSFPNYYQFAAGTNNINQYDVRIDENISSKDIIFGVFNHSNETIFVPPYLPGIRRGSELWGRARAGSSVCDCPRIHACLYAQPDQRIPRRLSPQH